MGTVREVVTAGGGSGGAAATVYFSPPGMRLTTESGVPVSTSDRTAQGTLYWTPYLGGAATYYTGTVWATKVQSELSLSLTLTSDKNYDVFYNGTALSLSSAWTDDVTRANALATQDGVDVLSSDHTKLWIGTTRASGANVTADSSTTRYVWNTYHQVARRLNVVDTTSHTFTTNQEWRAGTQMRLQFVLGNASSVIEQFSQVRNPGSADVRQYTNLDGTTDGELGQIQNGTATYSNTSLWYPGLGFHYVTIKEESGSGTGTHDFGFNRAVIFN